MILPSILVHSMGLVSPLLREKSWEDGNGFSSHSQIIKSFSSKLYKVSYFIIKSQVKATKFKVKMSLLTHVDLHSQFRPAHSTFPQFPLLLLPLLHLAPSVSSLPCKIEGGTGVQRGKEVRIQKKILPEPKMMQSDTGSFGPADE